MSNVRLTDAHRGALLTLADTLQQYHPNKLQSLADLEHLGDTGAVQVWEAESHTLRVGASNAARDARSVDGDAYLMGIAEQFAESLRFVAHDDTLTDSLEVLADLDRPRDYLAERPVSSGDTVQAWTDLRLWLDDDAHAVMLHKLRASSGDTVAAMRSALEVVGYRLLRSLLAMTDDRMSSVELDD